MSAAHTPTPWRVSSAARTKTRGVDILGDKINTLVACAPINQWRLESPHEENAAFIVRACNAHDELVAFVQHVADLHPDESIGNDARAALAKAGA